MGDKDYRARVEPITLVEAIGFYDGLSFGLSVVRQFFKLYNLSLPKLDLGSTTVLTPTVIKDTPRTFDLHHKLSAVLWLKPIAYIDEDQASTNAAGFRHSPVLPDQPPPRNRFAPLRPTVQVSVRHPPSGPLRIHWTAGASHQHFLRK